MSEDDNGFYVGYLAGRMVHIMACGNLDEAKITARDSLEKVTAENFSDDPEGRRFLQEVVANFDAELALEGAAT